MASQSMTLALYLAIALEGKDFNTTQTWVGMFLKYTICFSADTFFLRAVDARNKKEEDGDLRIFSSLVYNTSLYY